MSDTERTARHWIDGQWHEIGDVMFAVDYPFEENRVAVDVLEALDFGPEDTR